MDLRLKVDKAELERILSKEAVTVHKSWNCDPEYAVIKLFRKVRDWVCGRR